MRHSQLSIVTIFKFGNFEELHKTIKSISNQTKAPHEVVLVLSGAAQDTADRLKILLTCHAKLIIDKDNGLYDAMNIGVRAASGSHVMFLNGGDVFSDSEACRYITESIDESPQRALIFSTMQSYNGLRGERPKKNVALRYSDTPPHQGFVVPIEHASANLFDGERFPIAADHHWMHACLDELESKRFSRVVVEFELGGISNMPTFRTIFLRYREAGLIRALKELAKLFLVKMLGPRCYYKIMYGLR